MSKIRQDMQISCIEAFVHLARLNSQPAVAKELGCDQATVSRKIAALEEWIRRPLVYPGSPVEFTPDGERFVPVATEVLRLLNGLREGPTPLSKPLVTKRTVGKWRITHSRIGPS